MYILSQSFKMESNAKHIQLPIQYTLQEASVKLKGMPYTKIVCLISTLLKSL